MILLATILRALALGLGVAFMVRYARLRTPDGRRLWRRSPEGRHLMGMTGVIVATLIYAQIVAVATLIDPTPPSHDGDFIGRRLLGIALYGAVTYQLWRRYRLLDKAARQS